MARAAEETPARFTSKAGVEVEVLHRSKGRETIAHDMESDFIPARSVLIRIGGARVPIPEAAFDALFAPPEEKRQTKAAPEVAEHKPERRRHSRDS